MTDNDPVAVEMWHVLWDGGYNPFCPNLLQFLNFNRPMASDMEYKKSWLELCDAVLRLPGGDQEELTEYAASLGIPVVEDLLDLESRGGACEHTP